MHSSDINEVAINQGEGRVLAFCSLTLFNALAIHEIKFMEIDGKRFVSMPSRRVMDRCSHCTQKNWVQALFCNFCGHQLQPDRHGTDERGRPALYTDLVHPITARVRQVIEHAVAHEYLQSQEVDDVGTDALRG